MRCPELLIGQELPQPLKDAENDGPRLGHARLRRD